MSKSLEHVPCHPESLTLFLYDELDAAERHRVERHLRQCDTCRLELAQLRSALDLLPKGEPEVSAEQLRDFNERVSRSLRPRPRRSPGPVLGWSLAAAAAVLLMVMTLRAPIEAPQQTPAVVHQKGFEVERLPEPEMLLNMELLENMDLLQELEGPGASG